MCEPWYLPEIMRHFTISPNIGDFVFAESSKVFLLRVELPIVQP